MLFFSNIWLLCFDFTQVCHTGMRTYYMSAESYNDMAEWVQVLTPLCTLSTDDDVIADDENNDE